MSKTRLHIIKLAVLSLFLVVVSRLYYWQIIKSDDLTAEAESQYNSVQKITASRGQIKTSDGYILATNQEVFTLFAEPKLLTESAKSISEKLTPLLLSPLLPEEATVEGALELHKKELELDLIDKLSKDVKWIGLKRRISKETKESIEALHIKGLGFDGEEVRFYPESSMSAQLLGFVGSDELGRPKGYFGVEGQYNRELEGRSGYVKQEKDALGLPIALGGFNALSSKDGRDVVLTIRRDIQFLLEEKLQDGMQKYGAKAAEGIIMDPVTGKVLAIAAFPQYDPKDFSKYDPILYKSPIVSDTYEPGSTMKILTVSAGIDSGAVTPDTVCDEPCAGPRDIAGYTIKTWDNKYNPGETLSEGLARSDNTAMMFIADKVGTDTFVSYLQKFGLGDITHIDLSEEANPPFRNDWKPLDIATASFGQGISITGIQMIGIAQAIANKGMLVKPTVIEKVIDGMNTITVNPKTVRQVISQESARKVTEMMIGAVNLGDAKWAKPKGYVIAGKTGTAQIPVAGHYDEKKTIASFVGFAPADNPKFVMLIKLREPSTSQWGSETAAPLWFSIARDLFIKMNIPPSQN